MKLNKQVWVPALIAILIGGIVFTVVQVKKPGPLFSSADVVGCGQLPQALALANELNVRPVTMTRAEWDDKLAQYELLIDNYNHCYGVVCDQDLAAIDHYGQIIDELEIQRDELQAEIDWFVQNNGGWPGYTIQEQEELDRMIGEMAVILDQRQENIRLQNEVFDRSERNGCVSGEGSPEETDIPEILDFDDDGGDDGDGFGSGSGMGSGSY